MTWGKVTDHFPREDVVGSVRTKGVEPVEAADYDEWTRTRHDAARENGMHQSDHGLIHTMCLHKKLTVAFIASIWLA